MRRLMVLLVLALLTSFTLATAASAAEEGPWIHARQIAPESVNATSATVVQVEWYTPGASLEEVIDVWVPPNKFPDLNAMQRLGSFKPIPSKNSAWWGGPTIQPFIYFAVAKLTNGQIIVSDPLFVNEPGSYKYGWKISNQFDLLQLVEKSTGKIDFSAKLRHWFFTNQYKPTQCGTQIQANLQTGHVRLWTGYCGESILSPNAGSEVQGTSVSVLGSTLEQNKSWEAFHDLASRELVIQITGRRGKSTEVRSEVRVPQGQMIRVATFAQDTRIYTIWYEDGWKYLKTVPSSNVEYALYAYWDRGVVHIYQDGAMHYLESPFLAKR